jgi:biotin carboxyl carrier protein
VILEAMKMENMIKANKDGLVEEVLVRTDMFIEAGTTMIKFVEDKV